jgi:hypothetical protein
MYTRLTGSACPEVCWRYSTSHPRVWAVNATRPSTPAVARPALRSATCRTLTSVLARLRSISFCKLRTFFRSPACDALKILCRSLRTSSSARRQSTASQSKSSGPFTTPSPTAATIAVSVVGVMASNLPFGSAASGSVRQRPTWPTSAHFRAGAPAPYAASYPTATTVEGMVYCPGFLSPFGVPPFASWAILFPPGTSALLTVGLPAKGRTPSGFPRSARGRCGRGGCPLYPGALVSTRPASHFRSPAPLPSGRPCTPVPRPTFRSYA